MNMILEGRRGRWRLTRDRTGFISPAPGTLAASGPPGRANPTGRIWTRTPLCSTLILYSRGSDALRVFRLPIEVCMYAIVETGGKQYRVAPGDVLRVEKLAGDVGSVIELPVKAAFPEGGDIVTAGAI